MAELTKLPKKLFEDIVSHMHGAMLLDCFIRCSDAKTFLKVLALTSATHGKYKRRPCAPGCPAAQRP